MLKAILLLSILLISFHSANASHLAAADFKFTQFTTNTYQVELNLYRDCSGIGLPSSATIQVSSLSCGNSFSQSLTLNSSSYVNAIPISFTTCSSGTINGYEHMTYIGTITLPSTCSDWNFSYSSCCRNPYITNLVNPSTESLYVESTLDNTIPNNSPSYFVEPLYYGSIGNSFTVALGGTDPDGDSLSFRLENPLSSPGAPISFVAGLSINTPLVVAAGTTPSFSNTTGLFSCQLGQVNQIVVFDVIVDEYRNNTLIASHRRCLQILPISCCNTPSNLTSITPSNAFTTIQQDRIQYQPNQEVAFSMFFTDVDSNDIISLDTVQTSIKNTFPNAVINTQYNGPNQNELIVDVAIPTPSNTIIMIEVDDNSFLPRQYCFTLNETTITHTQDLNSYSPPIIWPNPSNGMIHINDQDIISFELFDRNGQLVFKKETSADFSLPDHLHGFYFYNLNTLKQSKRGKLLVY